jgi:hypothetical protein
MAIIEIDTAAQARQLLLALAGLAHTRSKVPLHYPPIRATPTPTGVHFDVTQGQIAVEIDVVNAGGVDREGVLLFTRDQISGLAATLAATDKRPWFDLWAALRSAAQDTGLQPFPPFEKVVALNRDAPTVEWACFDLALLARIEKVLALTTMDPPARILLRPTEESVIVEAGPVRGVVMGCRR